MRENFRTENGNVYFNDFLLKGVVEEGFEIIYTGNVGLKAILKDRKGIWWFYNFSRKPKVKFLTKDVDNFTVIDDDYAIDGTHVFLIAKSSFPIPDSDPDTFKIIDETPYFSCDKTICTD